MKKLCVFGYIASVFHISFVSFSIQCVWKKLKQFCWDLITLLESYVTFAFRVVVKRDEFSPKLDFGLALWFPFHFIFGCRSAVDWNCHDHSH